MIQRLFTRFVSKVSMIQSLGTKSSQVVEYTPDGMQIVEDIYEQIAAVTMGQVCSTSNGASIENQSQPQPQAQGEGTQHAADDGEREAVQSPAASSIPQVMASIKPLVVFVLGGPGAGKGTQCEKIVEKFGFVHLSAGELLRAERQSGSKDGELIETYIKNGDIVPVEITLSLLERSMNGNATKKFLIDGFPRNEDNLTGWNNKMKDIVDFKFVLFFDCSQDTCVQRILERGKTSGRSDDNVESLEKRFMTYVNSTKPIIDHYDAQGKVQKISAEADPDSVFGVVTKVFQEAGL